ncbi:MAG: TldD/PmbA family protein [Candidatus Odinarchaeota archaeon]|nr:TldD/PmbA family protein [Candidatus Odinarchaeota archaeon]
MGLMKDELMSIIDYGQKSGASYVEVRTQNISKTIISTKDGKVEVVTEGLESGAGIRVLVNGAWGFATVGSLDENSLKKAVEDAVKMAKVASEKVRMPVTLFDVKPVEDIVKIKPDIDPRDVSIDEKMSTVLRIDKTVFSYDKRVKSCTISYADITGVQYFANSDGTYIEQDKLYVWSRIFASAKEGDIFASGREEIGSTKGFGIWEKETPEKLGEKLGERIKLQLKAKPPKGGGFPAVLGPEIVGVFAHEAFGHLAEADLTFAGSVILDKLGRQVASKHVTIIDDGTVEGGFGSFKYDDEGVPAQKTVLIKDGVVVSLMFDREYAAKFEALRRKIPEDVRDLFEIKPTGNARAEDFRVPPLIRMRNTYIAPRDHSFEELVEDIDFGYYIVSFRGGQANLDGTFQVGVQEAYEIVKGEVGEPVRNMSISGNTLETLLKVDAVGKDFSLIAGRCGKGQTAFTGDGGPHLRVREILIGGAR